MTLKNDEKFEEELTCCFEIDIRSFFLFHNEQHLQCKPPKHKIKEKVTVLILDKNKDPYLQPEECKGKNNKQTKKQTFE